MKITGFRADVNCPVEWESGRYSAFAGAAYLSINGKVVADGNFNIMDGDKVEISTPCNDLRGTAEEVRQQGENYVFSLTDCAYDGAFRGIGGDYDGFQWNPHIPAHAPVETSLGDGVKTWGGYSRFRTELQAAAEATQLRRSVDATMIGDYGVPLPAAERTLKDFQANRPLSLSMRDFLT